MSRGGPPGPDRAGAAYEIRGVGAPGPAAGEAFRELALDLEPAATVVSGRLDQDQLHDVLARIQGLGLELIDIRQVGADSS